MKTTKRLTKKVTMILTCASLMLLTFGAWPAFAAGEVLEANEAVWGNPVSVQTLDTGLEKRFYKINNSMDIGFRYFAYKDGRVIDDGITNILPEVKKAEKKGLPVNELSQSYYRNHPTTAEEIGRTWGKPVAVRMLEDGSEERYYKNDNSMNIGFSYFLVKSGKVLAGGISNVTGVTGPKKEAKGVPIKSVKETGTETVEKVERVWGKPVGVKKLSDGIEERYYKIDNTMNIGNLMFLFKDGKAVGSAMANYN